MSGRLKSSNEHFIAYATMIGTCPSPKCRAVHVHLLDENDIPHAQFSLSCDDVEEFVENLRVTRDRIVHGGENKGLGQ